MSASISGCFEIPKISNAETAADERGQRKRMQNRLNRRAFRSRIREKQNKNGRQSRTSREYHVDHWRLDEDRFFRSAQESGNTIINGVRQTRSNQILATDTGFPLSPDHSLLHLIQYNVLRGLTQNKMVVDQLTLQYHISDNNEIELVSNYGTFSRHSVVLPATPHCSARSLTPTSSQMTVIHSSWINYIPFPRMRENLIWWEFDFDHSELVKDLVGDLINLNVFITTPSSSARRPEPTDGEIILQEVDDDEPVASTQSGSGLILWGEPYKAESWEATPEFFRKWAWAVAGCQELINSTNYWRVLRGENPLRLLSVDNTETPQECLVPA